ncbi:MAG: YegS/Rv2252/BmrU family lipid kinase [Verrucomicrobia bacterium]|nr:YegS/Rv2252/BmrU family lipid kinase [Verrucomicrobiota bacterium]
MATCIIFNPVARGDKARRFASALEQMAPGCALEPTCGPGSATALAAAAAAAGHDPIVAAGGDGTVNEVLNGLAVEPTALERVRLGVLPLGTVNVFALELGLPADLRQAIAIVRAGRETRVDLAVADSLEQGTPRRRYFVQLAGAGLDARAIECVRWDWKKRVGPLAYIAAGCQALRGPQPQVIVESDSHRAAGNLVLVGNGRFYGGRIPMFREADLRDGLLEVRVFPRADLVALARFGWRWLLRRGTPAPHETCFRANRFTLRSDTKLPFEVDGENVGWLPATFSVQRQALRVLVP